MRPLVQDDELGAFVVLAMIGYKLIAETLIGLILVSIPLQGMSVGTVLF